MQSNCKLTLEIEWLLILLRVSWCKQVLQKWQQWQHQMALSHISDSWVGKFEFDLKYHAKWNGFAFMGKL